MKISAREKELVSTALDFWANYVETGDITMSRTDAVNRKLERRIKSLTEDQEQLVRDLRNLAKRFL